MELVAGGQGSGLGGGVSHRVGLGLLLLLLLLLLGMMVAVLVAAAPLQIIPGEYLVEWRPAAQEGARGRWGWNRNDGVVLEGQRRLRQML